MGTWGEWILDAVFLLSAVSLGLSFRLLGKAGESKTLRTWGRWAWRGSSWAFHAALTIMALRLPQFSPSFQTALVLYPPTYLGAWSLPLFIAWFALRVPESRKGPSSYLPIPLQALLLGSWVSIALLKFDFARYPIALLWLVFIPYAYFGDFLRWLGNPGLWRRQADAESRSRPPDEVIRVSRGHQGGCSNA